MEQNQTHRADTALSCYAAARALREHIQACPTCWARSRPRVLADRRGAAFEGCPAGRDLVRRLVIVAGRGLLRPAGKVEAV